MKFKKLTAALLSAVTIAALPFAPGLRDVLQDAAVEAATYQDYYYYTSGSYKETMITYQLDSRNKLAYIYSCVGEGTDFTIPSTVNYDSRIYRVDGIRPKAFEEYHALKHVTIDKSMTISPYAFQNASGLETVTVAREAYGVTIGDHAFDHSSIRYFDCYCGAVVFENACFYQCMNLYSVHFHDNVSTICLGESLFFKLYGLKEFAIDNPNAFVCLAKGTFDSCGLDTIELPDTVTYIPENCFSYCNLTDFRMPESVKAIGSHAFAGSILPETFEICSGICYIADDAFVFSGGVNDYYIDPSNCYYATEDGILYNKTKTMLLSYPSSKTAQTFTCYAKFFPDYCFNNNDNLIELNLPNFLPYANGGTVDFPYLSNLERLNVPSYYSGNQIMTFFHKLFADSKLHMINGEELLYTPQNDAPYFHEKYAAYICKHFDKFVSNDIMKTYVDKMEDYILEHEILTPGMTDIQKIMHIRKWIMDRVVYDPAVLYGDDYEEEDPDDNEMRNHCLGSVLLHQKIIGGVERYATVCEGYAECYASLLTKAGINAVTVEGGTHMWNLINLNGQWYHSDICWDDVYIDYASEYSYPQPFTYCLVPDSLINDPNDQHDEFNWHVGIDGKRIYKGTPVAVTDSRDMGDVDGDGAFTQTDVYSMRNEIGTTNSARIAICDLDFDGQVTEEDAVILQEYVDDKWKYCATPRIWRYYYYEAH